MCRHVGEVIGSALPDLGVVHFSLAYFAEIALHTGSADGNEIHATVVIVPTGAGGWDAVGVLKFIHIIHIGGCGAVP